jgi:hypothetical protein
MRLWKKPAPLGRLLVVSHSLPQPGQDEKEQQGREEHPQIEMDLAQPTSCIHLHFPRVSPARIRAVSARFGISAITAVFNP